ncbi:MFS transporter [Pseudarthrobacter sulfonivorans]|uniref:MFS transporter n=1 Tax=Pseudarthrobacter sulfonivorans TaxID=121292 RepID=UPI0028642EBC|nr:MFS transporter [Pseudarthrobacter sulfonivorans]MDR6417602.1 MHS family proline/betaine transporter-like MFS transporter [Pseudarthrobacter sulfonivorans]
MPNRLVRPAANAGISRGRLAIAVISTVVEWYDFTLFLYLSSMLSRVFFGDSPTGVLMTLATFAVSYLLRPIGGLVFGYVGDRWGRRPVLLASMALMFVATAGMAALPTFSQVGESAAFWLLAVRCLMAFSVGGEYTGVMTYLLESSRARNRGLVTSLAAAASEVGALLAAGISALTVMALSASQLEEWGWRIPFIIGGVLAAVILALRSALPETPLFLQSQLNPQRESLVRVLRRQWRAVIRTFIISGLCSAAYYVGIIYLPTYLISVQKWSESSALGLAVLAAVVVVFASPLAGWLSDRHGRRRTLLVLAAAAVVLPVPMFAAAGQSNIGIAIAAVVVLACLAGSLSAVGASAIPEQFDVRGRLTALAIGGTVATTIFGGIAPYAVQTLIESTNWPLVPGILIAAVALVAIPAIRRGPETVAGSDESSSMDAVQADTKHSTDTQGVKDLA